MPTNRQDAWSHDEDLLLAEVVLRHIREGGTQLQAFEEVGKQLSRTAAACGFRWNSYVRKQYKSGIELAKKQRKELRRQGQSQNTDIEENKTEIVTPEPPRASEGKKLSFEELSEFLQELYEHYEQTKEYSEKQSSYERQIQELEMKTKELTEEKEKLLKELRTIEQDYRALIEIMERARKMVVLQEEDRQQKVKFQMDQNGNLERVEK